MVSDRLRFIRLLTAAALLSLAVSPAAAQSLVGFWLGHGQPGDEGVVYVSEIRADGTFTSEFRRYEGCRMVDKNVESGTWTLNGNVEEMITTIVDGNRVTFGNTYTIERLTATEQHARLQKNGHLFVERRLTAFEFPPCQDGA